MDVKCPPPVAAVPASAAVDERHSAVAGRITHYDDYHRFILTLAAGILVMACILQVRADQRVAVSLLPNWPLPEVCQSKRLLGWDCPGCGLTRSFVHLAHGDVAASLAVHPVGWLVAFFVAAQIPYRLRALRTRSSAPLGERLPWILTGAVVILLIASWLARLLT